MAATAAGYIALGMAPGQASILAGQVEGTPSAVILIGTGFSVPLANELVRQMTAGEGEIEHLMGLGVPPSLAALIAADIEAT